MDASALASGPCEFLVTYATDSKTTDRSDAPSVLATPRSSFSGSRSLGFESFDTRTMVSLSRCFSFSLHSRVVRPAPSGAFAADVGAQSVDRGAQPDFASVKRVSRR